MEVSIERSSADGKLLLARLLELYFYDFTEFCSRDIGEDGLYGYQYLDCYWIETGRYPFFIRVDSKIAGFAFVRFIGEGEDGFYSIAEFFVMRKYRKFGIGKKVAFYLFEMFNGSWEVAETFENIPAQKFWRRIIGEYTNGKFEEVQREDWNGFIQKFKSLRKGKI